MARKARFDDDYGQNHDGHGHDDDHWGHGPGDDHDHHGDDNGNNFQFDFDLFDSLKFNLSTLNLLKLGKVTDCTVEPTELSVTFGNRWTFAITGSDLDVTLKSGHKLPVVNGGTIDSFSIDGPGKADISISGLDLDAKEFVKALTNLQTSKLLDLVLGGDETISGSGFGDFLYGGKGNDTLLGNDGADHLLGGAGNDIIDGGSQSDLLSGGAGADTFVFAPGSGMDLIVDFNAVADKLDLTAYGFTGSVSDLFSGHGDCHSHHFGEDDVVLDLGQGSMVKLLGVSASELNSDNVLL